MKRITLFFATIATVVLMAVSPASAASPSQRECEAQQGTFTRSGGEVQCIVVEEGKNPKFTEETETTGQGNISNKQEQDTECGGTGSNKCPPGQF